MALVLLRYVKNDQSIDFGKLENDLIFDKDYSNKKKLTLIEKLFDVMCLDMAEIKSIAKSATYKLIDKEFEYKKIRALSLEQFKKNDGFVHENTYEFMVPYWTNMLGYVLKISDSKAKLENFVQHREKFVLKNVFVASAGPKVAEEFKYNYKKYIVLRMKKLGITWK